VGLLIKGYLPTMTGTSVMELPFITNPKEAFYVFCYVSEKLPQTDEELCGLYLFDKTTTVNLNDNYCSFKASNL